MIRDNQKVLNRIHVLLDAMLIAGSYILAWYIKFELLSSADDVSIGHHSMETYFSLLYYIIPGYLVIYYLCDLYISKRYSSVEREIFNVFKANVLGIGVIIMIMYIRKLTDFSRAMMFYFFLLSIFSTVMERQVIRKVLRTIRKRGYNLKHVVLVVIHVRRNPISTGYWKTPSGAMWYAVCWMTIYLPGPNTVALRCWDV